jgi:hypothetical protein
MQTATSRYRGGRAIAVIAAALGALFIASGSAFAATELDTSGSIGQHSMTDSQGDVVCSYGDTGYLEAISIAAPPQIYARNKTNGVDQQQVGWRFVVKSRLSGPGNPFTTLYTSTVVKLTATDATAAAFLPRKVAMAFPDASAFKVIVKMFWYRNDGSVAGWAKTRIDNYTSHHGVLDEYPGESCSSFFA